MKILHTSDWHLGQTFYDYDRSAEHEDMLRQITDVVRSEQPDALVISGDVFHNGNPSPRAVKMYNRALLDMHVACPEMQIVVTAGNHDSSVRLTANNDLWDCHGVVVVGNVAKTENGAPDYDRHVVKVCTADGELKGFVAAVPHCYYMNFPATDPEVPRDERMAAYFSGLSEWIGAINPERLPVVLMAHTAVTGCDVAGHDNIGGMETQEARIFGDGFDYIALGHIHAPQNITDNMRYCGTPIPVNFGEVGEHSVTIVTLEPGAEPIIETRPIVNLIPMVDYPEKPAPLAEVLEQIATFPDDRGCYMRVLVSETVDELNPLAKELIAEAIRDKQCRLCILKAADKRHTEGDVSAEVSEINRERLNAMSPLEVAELFFKMKGIEITDRQREMIREATNRVENKE